jgi:hypothetical protein
MKKCHFDYFELPKVTESFSLFLRETGMNAKMILYIFQFKNGIN